MKIIRHIHACVEVLVDETRIIIDPGEFGIPDSLDQADAILITHHHFDHVDQERIKKLVEKKPHIKVFGPSSFADDVDFPVTIAKEGDDFSVGDARISVHGQFQDIANLADDPIENVGYLINDFLLHPGDALPKIEDIPAVLLPMAAPWVKTRDIQTYLRNYKPRFILPNHDLILNDMGREFSLKTFEQLAKEIDATVYGLQPGQSIEFELNQ
ncbi:MBL fold metallo-hydrolase [Streptococcus sp. X16XC17]|uniref:MBL fold metallo-hydrolase n=1 Tax=Streptococcus sp. X16XC17 TaxID=2316646 RepID=UPI00103FC6F8|nr:MBL fold metallo-hydrolase [Streptococcus sp. X16XC17]TCD46305.1 MBL fold metallo-hydrolase [Streptococcus sp. X16XC17]